MGALQGNHSFRLLVIAKTVSIAGDRFAEVAIPIIVLSATGSRAATGLVAASLYLPGAAAGLLMGAIVDRDEPVRLMVRADGVRAALVLAFGFLAMSLPSPLVPMILLAGVLGLADVTHSIAMTVVVPRLVARKELVRANAAFEVGDAAATVVGPGLAGLFVQTFGAVSALGINAASFIGSIAAERALARRTAGSSESATPKSAQGPQAWSMGDGWRLVLRSRQQLGLQLSLFALNLTSGALVTLVVLLLGGGSGTAATSVGVVLGAAGVGGFVGSVFISPRLELVRWTLPAATCLTVGAAAVVALATSTRLLPAIGFTVLLDGALSVGFVVVGAARQRITAQDLLGRVTGASVTLNAIARGAGAGITGILAGLIGFPAASVALAIPAVLTAVFLVLAIDSRDLGIAGVVDGAER